MKGNKIILHNIFGGTIRKLIFHKIAICLILPVVFFCDKAKNPYENTNDPVNPAETTNVLFLSTSMVIVNDLPQVFKDLAKSGGYIVHTDTNRVGTLEKQVNSQVTAEKIRKRDWDYIVLVEHSIRASVQDSCLQKMYPAARTLDNRIKQRGAKTVFYLHIAYQKGFNDWDAGIVFSDYDTMQQALINGYIPISNELNAIISPVGFALKEIYTPGEADFWASDGYHQNIAGQYLASCIFYAVLFKESPQGLSYKAGLPNVDARFLQDTAAEIVLEDLERWNIE